MPKPVAAKRRSGDRYPVRESSLLGTRPKQLEKPPITQATIARLFPDDAIDRERVTQLSIGLGQVTLLHFAATGCATVSGRNKIFGLLRKRGRLS